MDVTKQNQILKIKLNQQNQLLFKQKNIQELINKEKNQNVRS